MGGCRAAIAILAVGLSLMVQRGAHAQVAAEPALLTASPATTETFQLYVSFPEDAYVLGGMIRFPVTSDVDIGARAGLWLIDNADDTPFAGADLRYGLLSRALSGAGALNLSFDVGLGVSEPGPTVWKIPLGFLAGLGFGPGGETVEVFAHPRFEFGLSSGDDDTDGALILDLGGLVTFAPPVAAMLDFRFGDGLFGEGDQVVFAVSAFWRI